MAEPRILLENQNSPILQAVFWLIQTHFYGFLNSDD